MNSSFVPNDTFREYKYHTVIRPGDDGSVTASAEEMGIRTAMGTEESRYAYTTEAGNGII